MRLVIQVDASVQMGTGHLMRCLALAQGLADLGQESVILTSCSNEALIGKVKRAGIETASYDSLATSGDAIASIQGSTGGWVVLDGYHFVTEYQKALKDAGHRLLVIDDFAHLDHYFADIILNQNYGAGKYSYSAEPGTRLLLGTEYALLRREFLRYGDFKRVIPDMAGRLLITLGGSDPNNGTLKILEALNAIELTLDVKVVVGAANPHMASIGKTSENSRHNIEILSAVDNMAPLMAWADAAVSAGGSTVWELAFMGLPALLCIIADNQEPSVRALEADGVFPSAGDISVRTVEEITSILSNMLADSALRGRISKRGQEIVDGLGIRRIYSEMKAI